MSAHPLEFDPVIDAETLAESPEEYRIVDVRWYLDGRSGKDAYLAGHLPGAVFVDLDVALCEHRSPSEGRHPLPSPAHFASSLAAAGIGELTPVVAYDDTGGGTAGRLVWMLRSIGQAAAVLDGGIAAWSGPLALGDEPVTPEVREVHAWPDDLLNTLEDLDALEEGAVVLDARAPERYRGDVEPVDPRAGHIPVARNLPWVELLDGRGRFAHPAQIRERLLAEGVTDAATLVASCGSGVTACAILVAAEHAGMGRGRLFVPSFSGWSSTPSRQVTTGP